MVLGIEWLRTLGPIQAYFSISSIAFTHLNKQITLKSTTTPTPTPTQVIYHQLCQILSTHAMASLHLLSVETPSPSSLPIEFIFPRGAVNLASVIKTPYSPLYHLPFFHTMHSTPISIHIQNTSWPTTTANL